MSLKSEIEEILSKHCFNSGIHSINMINNETAIESILQAIRKIVPKEQIWSEDNEMCGYSEDEFIGWNKCCQEILSKLEEE